MALQHTITEMYKLLNKIKLNLYKTEKGNKTAAQRTRTLTIQFAKCSKIFRKESIAAEKRGLFKKPSIEGKTLKKKTQKRVLRSRHRRR